MGLSGGGGLHIHQDVHIVIYNLIYIYLSTIWSTCKQYDIIQVGRLHYMMLGVKNLLKTEAIYISFQSFLNTGVYFFSYYLSSFNLHILLHIDTMKYTYMYNVFFEYNGVAIKHFKESNLFGIS